MAIACHKRDDEVAALKVRMDKYLSSIYYDPKHPASYTNPTKLYRVAKADGKKITLQQIREWLKGQETYTLHRQVKRKFPRNKVVVNGIDEQWDADLMDMVSLTKHNDGVRYVLVAIDIFSRYTWLRPLKTKHAKEVVVAFESIFTEGRKPFRLRVDKGTEFVSHVTQQFLKEQGVKQFFTENEVKANYAERVIKTIKGRIFKYFTKKQTYRYIDHLEDFVDSYNHTYHRSIKMKPADVTKENERALWKQQYGNLEKQRKKKGTTKFKFEVGNLVRISYLRHSFMREYEQKWTEEIFRVAKRYARDGLPIYKLKEYDNEPVEGTFYEQELQLVREPKVYRIEKVLRTRKVKGKKQHLVRWIGWSSKYDSWIDDNELKAYQKS